MVLYTALLSALLIFDVGAHPPRHDDPNYNPSTNMYKVIAIEKVYDENGNVFMTIHTVKWITLEEAFPDIDSEEL